MTSPDPRQRPLPSPPHLSPIAPWQSRYPSPMFNSIHPFNDPYDIPSPYPPYPPYPPHHYDEPPSTSVPAGTFLHKGFYDLLSMIPTPSPSRLLWKAPAPSVEPPHVVAGPRYEDLDPNSATRAMPKKGRRVSKDMVSKPTGFVYALSLHLLYLFF